MRSTLTEALDFDYSRVTQEYRQFYAELWSALQIATDCESVTISGQEMKKIWLHLKNISLLVCDLQCQQGKKYCEYLWYIELKVYLSVLICILNWLDWAKLARGNVSRRKPFQVMLSAAYSPQITTIVYYVLASTQPHCATAMAKTYLDTLTFCQHPDSLRGNRNINV